LVVSNKCRNFASEIKKKGNMINSTILNLTINRHFKSNNRNWIAKVADVPRFVIIEKDERFPNSPLASNVALFILRNYPEVEYVLVPQFGMTYTRNTLRRAGHKIK
jgi:hypothetical protein